MIEVKQLSLFDEIKDRPIQSKEIAVQPISVQKSEAQDVEDITPKVNTEKAQEVVKSIYKLWQTIEYNAKLEDMLEIFLLVLERKNEEYLERIKGVKKEVLTVYSKILAELIDFFTIGFYYDDILGRFYQSYFSRGSRGEYYTPWNIAVAMAEVLEPKPNETVNDPAVGSGVMLLAAKYVIHKNYGWQVASRYGRKLYGMDISNTAVMMCKIQLCLTDYLYMRDLLIVSAFDVRERIKEQEGLNGHE